MICNLEYVKVIQGDQVLFKRYKQTLTCQTQKEKKAFFRESPVPLFQVKMYDCNSVNPVGLLNFAGTISVAGSLN